MGVNARQLNIGFIGAGKVAGALSRALERKGFKVTSVASRSFEAAKRIAEPIAGCRAVETAQQAADSSDLVFITTPDCAITPVCASVKWKPGHMVAHTSGADSAAALEPAARMKAATGVFHPLQTIAGRDSRNNPFEGITITLEGDAVLLPVLAAMAESLGATPLELKPEARVAYHASAVIASNYMVALASLACRLWQSFGYDQTRALQALLPLMQGTLSNLEHTGLPGCLTGPVSRGDSRTIGKHLAALEAVNPAYAETYRSLGLITTDIAREKGGLCAEKIEEITRILSDRENDHAKNHA